jgi:hypothetical protein
MSPIRPENKARYPSSWKEISFAIRERAESRCECEGECGIRQHTHAPSRCTERHNEPARRYPHSRVTLTEVYVNYNARDTRPENVRAMCRACRLRYDEDHYERAGKMDISEQLALL